MGNSPFVPAFAVDALEMTSAVDRDQLFCSQETTVKNGCLLVTATGRAKADGRSARRMAVIFMVAAFKICGMDAPVDR